jgi:hypothetical protein
MNDHRARSTMPGIKHQTHIMSLVDLIDDGWAPWAVRDTTTALPARVAFLMVGVKSDLVD